MSFAPLDGPWIPEEYVFIYFKYVGFLETSQPIFVSTEVDHNEMKSASLPAYSHSVLPT